MKNMRDDMDGTGNSSVGRRDLMKLGAGAVAAAFAAQQGSAQRGEARAAIAPGAMRAPGEIAPFTGPGYKNDYGRFKQNGPMDDTTRKIVKFVHDFNQSNMSAATIKK